MTRVRKSMPINPTSVHQHFALSVSLAEFPEYHLFLFYFLCNIVKFMFLEAYKQVLNHCLKEPLH